MEWQIILALAIGIPIILFPVAFIWFINIGGIVAAFKKARERRAVRANKKTQDISLEQEYEKALVDTMERYPWMQ
jgi:uncharacterized membrane protein